MTLRTFAGLFVHIAKHTGAFVTVITHVTAGTFVALGAGPAFGAIVTAAGPFAAFVTLEAAAFAGLAVGAPEIIITYIAIFSGEPFLAVIAVCTGPADGTFRTFLAAAVVGAFALALAVALLVFTAAGADLITLGKEFAGMGDGRAVETVIAAFAGILAGLEADAVFRTVAF